MFEVKWWIIAIGAVLTVVSWAFTGMRLQKALARVGIVIPKDAAAIVGLIAGAIAVALWL